MKRHYLPMTLLVLFSNFVVGKTSPTVSIDFQDGPLPELIRALAGLNNAKLNIDPAITGTISIHLTQTAWRAAWEQVAKRADLQFTYKDNLITVNKDFSASDNTRQQDGSEKQTTIALSPLHRNVKSLATMIKAEANKVLHERYSILADEEANRLIITASPKRMAEIKEWFFLLDKPIDQIEITAHIVTINEENLKELGVTWHSYDAGSIEAMLSNPAVNIPLSVPGAAINARITLAKLSGGFLDLELSALELENQIDIIASPRLVTSNLKMASIKQGTEIPYTTSSGKRDEYPVIEFKEAVLGMQITPEVMGNQMIRLRIHLTQNVPGKALHESDNSPISIDKQEITTDVMIRNGQTLALGGIFQQQSQSERRQVPGFGSLPFIGALFRRDIRQERRRELVIFITPNLQSNN